MLFNRSGISIDLWLMAGPHLWPARLA